MSEDNFLQQLDIAVGQLQRKANAGYPLPFPSHLASKEAEYLQEEQLDRQRRAGGGLGSSTNGAARFTGTDLLASGSFTQASADAIPVSLKPAPQPTTWEDPTVAWLLKGLNDSSSAGTPTKANQVTPATPAGRSVQAGGDAYQSLASTVSAEVFQQFNATLLRADGKLRMLGPSVTLVDRNDNSPTTLGLTNKAMPAGSPTAQHQHSPLPPHQREVSLTIQQPIEVADWWLHFNTLKAEGHLLLQQQDELLKDLTAMSDATRAVTEQSSHLSENASVLLLRKAQLESTSHAMTAVLKRFNAMDDSYRAAHHPGLTALSPQFAKLLDATEEGMSFLTSASATAVLSKPQQTQPSTGPPNAVDDSDGASKPSNGIASEADSFPYSPIDFKSTKAYTAKMASAHHQLVTMLKDTIGHSFEEAAGSVMGADGGRSGLASVTGGGGVSLAGGGGGGNAMQSAVYYAKCFRNPKKAVAALSRHHGNSIGGSGAAGGVGGGLGTIAVASAVLGRSFDAAAATAANPSNPGAAHQQQQAAANAALAAAAGAAAAEMDAEVRATVANKSSHTSYDSDAFRMSLATINDAFLRRVSDGQAPHAQSTTPHPGSAASQAHAATGSAAAALRRLFESRCASSFQQAMSPTTQNTTEAGVHTTHNIFSTAASATHFGANFTSANPFAGALQAFEATTASPSADQTWEAQLFNDVMASYANTRMGVIGPIIRDQLESYTEACERVLGGPQTSTLLPTTAISQSQLILPLITERALLVLRDALLEEKRLYEALWLPAANDASTASTGVDGSKSKGSATGLVDDKVSANSIRNNNGLPVCGALLGDLATNVYHFFRSQLIMTDGFPSLAVTCQYLLSVLVAGGNGSVSASSGGSLWQCLMAIDCNEGLSDYGAPSVPSAVALALAASAGTPSPSSDDHARQQAQQRVASALQAPNSSQQHLSNSFSAGAHQAWLANSSSTSSHVPQGGTDSSVASATAAANANPIVRMLRDTQERLVFRCNVHLRQEIANHKSDPKEAVLLLRLLLSPAPSADFSLAAAPVDNNNNNNALVDASSAPSGASPQAAVFQDQPTVLTKGITFLNLLYPVVDNTIFNTFAEECLRLLRASVGTVSRDMLRLSTDRVKTVLIEPIKNDLMAAAAAASAAKSTQQGDTDVTKDALPQTALPTAQPNTSDPKEQLAIIDQGITLDLRRGPLALHSLLHRLRCLLTLRELIGRYPAAFAAPVTESRLDLAAMVMHRRFDLVAKTVDVRRDVEEDLRAVCEELIDVCAKACVDAFKAKKDAPQLVLPPTIQMVATPFRPAAPQQDPLAAATPETETAAAGQENQLTNAAVATPTRPSSDMMALSPVTGQSAPLQSCRGQLAFIIHLMGRYISNSASRAVLLRPIKSRVASGGEGLVTEEDLN